MHPIADTAPVAPSVGWSWTARALALLALAGAEVIGLSLRFDTASLAGADSLWALALDRAPQALMAGLAALAALGVILAPRLKDHALALALGPDGVFTPSATFSPGDRGTADATASPKIQAKPISGDPWPLALGLHLALFVPFAWLTGQVVEHAAATPVWLALGWLLLGLAVAAAWFAALAPMRRWWRLIRMEWSAILIAALVGFATWAIGTLARDLWGPLAGATFEVTRAMLGLVYPEVLADAGEHILGVGTFKVRIAPQCSGYEGMALITAFLGLYLYQFRRELRLPQALLLIPLGILVLWLFNSLRIAVLIAIGTSWSREIALGGFHSQAGWIGFILVALGLVALAHRSRLFARSRRNGAPTVGFPVGATNDADMAPGEGEGARLATALLLPWLVLMAGLILGSALTQGFDWSYPIRVLAVGAALWWFRDLYLGWVRGWSWPGIGVAVGIGVATFVLWLALVPGDAQAGAALAAHLEQLPPWLALGWICLRVLGSVVTVPVAEELAFRGYLLGRLATGDLRNPPGGPFTWLSFLVSSLAFGLLHGSWVAGSLAGAAFALALYHRGRIMDAVLAHMTTNALIAAMVLGTGRWGLWA